MHELWGNVDLEGSNLNRLINDKLKEKLIDALQMWPGRVDLILLLNTSLRELQIGFLDIRQWPENVLLNHRHYIIQVWNNEAHHGLLVLKELLDFVNCV